MHGCHEFCCFCSCVTVLATITIINFSNFIFYFLCITVSKLSLSFLSVYTGCITCINGWLLVLLEELFLKSWFFSGFTAGYSWCCPCACMYVKTPALHVDQDSIALHFFPCINWWCCRKAKRLHVSIRIILTLCQKNWCFSKFKPA